MEAAAAGSLRSQLNLPACVIALPWPQKFFGVKGFGFTKENELFVGR